ncbi:MAG: hypothetical protein H8E38_06760 [SAR324 cluster bacterium]|nr:hypothetical protein [SAR324 cluster bacterium]MBL7034751.1 hypothetical protein [SAR324 cluster bacterium]
MKLMILVVVLFFMSIILFAGDNERWEREEYGSENEMLEEVSEGLGVLALWGFVLLNGLYYYSMVFKRIPKNSRKVFPQTVKQPLKWKAKFRRFHYLGNPFLLVIAWLHGVTAESSNQLVWGGWGIMVLLALSGLIMKIQRADQPGAKVTRLLHAQHFLSVLMIFALWAGHLPLD